MFQQGLAPWGVPHRHTLLEHGGRCLLNHLDVSPSQRLSATLYSVRRCWTNRPLLWRSVKEEELDLKEYASGPELEVGLERSFHF